MEQRLTLGPAWVQLVKPALTRARTTVWRARGQPSKPGLRILFYHRVARDRDPLAIAPARFGEQMRALRAAGYRALDVVAAVDALRRGEPLDRIVALSFDDGYRDVAEHALPELERHGFRATVFVAPDVVDGTAAFSWYEQQPPVLGWSEIEALDAGSPLTFEAHTLTHPDLTALDDATAEREIGGSREALEARLGRRVRAFCYPAGLYGPRERALVQRAGFELATTCEPGVNTAATDPLALRRIPVDRHDSGADFKAKVAGGHDRPSLVRASYRWARRTLR